MPDTKPGISFVDGVCNACLNAEKNDSADWAHQWDILDSRYSRRPQRTGAYHCLIPVSGGKDSTFLAMKARELGLNPLCVNVAPCEPTERGEKNLRNLSKLGFDIFRFFPNQRIMPTLVKRSFVEDGDPCTSHEFMLYSVPVRVALQYKIPLIFWAEDPQFEYGNPGDVTDASEQANIAGLWGRPATHWACEGVPESDLIPFSHPTASEIKSGGLKAVYMSRYIRWDSRKIAEFAVKNGLEVRPEHELIWTGGYWDFEQLDDETPVIGHYLKYIKFGYGRATDQACRDIRLGYITREQGLELANQYDGHISQEYIDNFCRYIDITLTEFNRICETFRGKKQ
jgi:N-acetyl sugar amidotransferase